MQSHNNQTYDCWFNTDQGYDGDVSDCGFSNVNLTQSGSTPRRRRRRRKIRDYHWSSRFDLPLIGVNLVPYSRLNNFLFLSFFNVLELGKMNRLFLRRAASIDDKLPFSRAINLFHYDVGKVFRFSIFFFFKYHMITIFSRPEYFIHLFDDFSTGDGLMTFGYFQLLWSHLSNYRFDYWFLYFDDRFHLGLIISRFNHPKDISRKNDFYPIWNAAFIFRAPGFMPYYPW